MREYSPEALRVKILRRWWSVVYPLAYSEIAVAWRQYLSGKPDQLSIVRGFLEIEEQCAMSFVWFVRVGTWQQYFTHEVHWIVRYDRDAGRVGRFNMHGSVASRCSRSGRSDAARFSVKSA